MNLEYFGVRLPDADVEWGNLDNDDGEITFDGPSITIILDLEENLSESEVRVTLERNVPRSGLSRRDPWNRMAELHGTVR